MTEEAKFVVEPVAEKKVEALPLGPLFWRLENFPTLKQAESAAGQTSLVAQIAGKAPSLQFGRNRKRLK